MEKWYDKVLKQRFLWTPSLKTSPGCFCISTKLSYLSSYLKGRIKFWIENQFWDPCNKWKWSEFLRGKNIRDVTMTYVSHFWLDKNAKSYHLLFSYLTTFLLFSLYIVSAQPFLLFQQKNLQICLFLQVLLSELYWKYSPLVIKTIKSFTGYWIHGRLVTWFGSIFISSTHFVSVAKSGVT